MPPQRFQPLRVAGRGICCAVGHRAQAAVAAINARVNHFRETGFIDQEGGPVVGGALHDVSIWGEERWHAMLYSVITESLASLTHVSFERVAVVMLSAEPERIGITHEGFGRVLAELMNTRCLSGAGRFHALSRRLAYGKGGIAQALEEISAILCQRGGPDYVVLAAADSFLHAGAIEHYLEAERIATPSNPDGFIPAEGASAVLLSHRAEGRTESLWIEGCATHDDPWRVGCEEPQRALALTRAIRDAAQEAGVEVSALAFHASGMTGESWSAKEINLALSRSLERRVAEFPHSIIAGHVGETGAAAPVLALAWLADAMGRGDGPGRSALLHFAGDDGRRAALVVRFRSPGPG
ncbi:hypothetical protein [Variovorax paradoxus]|nr:hypothetical protein [Variovorax paradoxus]